MILVTGATGNVGREVVKLLVERGQEVAAVTRKPETAALPAGARVVSGDPSRPETLTSALQGAEAILLSPRAVGEATVELLSLAAKQGVKRVVVLSAVTVEYGGGYERFAAAFKATEDAAKASGLEWTFLRCAQFDSNALIWAPQIRAAGTVRGAYGDAASSPIHVRDIAEMAVQALLNPEHAGRSYAITGPQSLTQRDQVQLIGEALGRALEWQELPPEAVKQAMMAQGAPEEVPDRMLGYLAACLQQPGPSTAVVEQVLGRPALTFAAWAGENTAAFQA